MQNLDQLAIKGCSFVNNNIVEFLGFGDDLAIEQKCLAAHAFAKQNPTIIIGVFAFIFLLVVYRLLSKK
jgi:hypothetical protein